ncbi:hypothetical protein DL96DRAFT_1668749 [Flagelloscypha sp. PMI_526]|nr:hypothetical protein DL96DRAFT_1668749 [Flagelloscypha sp. PMI_526]
MKESMKYKSHDHDLDSVASSIAYAWFNKTLNNQPTIPLVRIEHEDLVLRPENMKALATAGIDKPAEQLLCLTEVTSLPSISYNNIVLVDHNRLGPPWSKSDPPIDVVAVIDHHEDEGSYKSNANPRVVEPAGSCASLITRHWRSLDASFPPELSHLLLSAILLDTGGLSPKGKAVDADRVAASYLIHSSGLVSENSVTASSSSTEPGQTVPLHKVPEVRQLSDLLSDMKEDISSLSIRDLLRRDYKEYQYTFNGESVQVGLATVPLKLGAWANTEKMGEESLQFMRSRGVSILGILTTFKTEKKKKHKRQTLWVFDIDGKDHLQSATETLTKGLELSEELKLVEHKKFQLTTNDTGCQWKAYKQGNAKATRKAVAPLVKDLLDTTSSSNDTKE